MTTYIGIDQSYKNCAYVILDDSGSMSKFGIVRAASSGDVYDTAASIAAKITDIVSGYDEVQVFIEGLAFGMSGNATRDLAGLLFVIITTLRKQTANINLLPPTTVKKFATGSGKAVKADMMLKLPEGVMQQFKDANYKKTTGLSDLADAYWIASCGRSSIADKQELGNEK